MFINYTVTSETHKLYTDVILARAQIATAILHRRLRSLRFIHIYAVIFTRWFFIGGYWMVQSVAWRMSELVRSSMITTDWNVAGDVIKRVQEGIYVPFDVVCMHSFNSERLYPVFVKAVKGYFEDSFLGLFWASEFGLHHLTVQPTGNWKPCLQTRPSCLQDKIPSLQTQRSCK
jgi:hypothetical protein